MRTQLTISATLIVAAVLSAGIPAFDVVAAGQRGHDGETRRYSVDSDGVKAEVLRLDQKIADAVIRGDTAYVASVTAADFVMVHGDGWTNGGEPLLTDTKESWLFVRRMVLFWRSLPSPAAQGPQGDHHSAQERE